MSDTKLYAVRIKDAQMTEFSRIACPKCGSDCPFVYDPDVEEEKWREKEKERKDLSTFRE